MNFRVVYSPDQVAFEAHSISPSAWKPKAVAEALAKQYPSLEFDIPNRVSRDDFKLCHDPQYVDDIFALKRPNGFGTLSEAINASLPYTTGAMLTAALLTTPETPACALVSGFHHAGYNGFENLGHFCTFNGLMVTAMKMLKKGMKRVVIIDCDAHYGNGTSDILDRVDPNEDTIFNLTFGNYFDWRNPQARCFVSKDHAANIYLSYLHPEQMVFYKEVKRYAPDLILYQAGADTHIDDPIGSGILTTEQMYERDKRVFALAKDIGCPIAWNLAGGYQVDADGSIDKVVQLHLNTFRACEEVYG